MKRIFLVAAGLTLCLTFAPAIGHAASQPSQAVQKSQGAARETTKTFTGTVMKQGDLYVLTDKADKTNYQLDDLKKASDYEGKKVKVTGTLDAENLTIHVQTIVEIS